MPPNQPHRPSRSSYDDSMSLTKRRFAFSSSSSPTSSSRNRPSTASVSVTSAGSFACEQAASTSSSAASWYECSDPATEYASPFWSQIW